jgi:ligand-binding SRPBCC domain-containing protein
MYVLTCQMKTPVSRRQAFAVFESPYNLARITPSWLHFRITTPGQVAIRKDAEIEYEIRWLGVPIRWKTIITEYYAPRMFEDEQARGPYRFWRHHHGFEETEGGTIVSDRVEYDLPLGALGSVAHALVVGRQLRGIFGFRQKALIPLLGGDPGSYKLSPVTITRARS